MKAVFFDLDGVLTKDKYGCDSIVEYLAEKTGLSRDKVKEVYGKYDNDILWGRTTHREIWNAFCADLGADIAYSILADAYRENPMDQGMIALARELKKKYRIGLITDNESERVRQILRFHQLEDLFDAVIISAEQVCRKTSRAIFDKALALLGVEAQESIFIDNTPRNLVIPEELGIQAVWFDDEKRDLSELREKLAKLLA